MYTFLTDEEIEKREPRWAKQEELDEQLDEYCKLRHSEEEGKEEKLLAAEQRIRDLGAEVGKLRSQDLEGTIDDLYRGMRELQDMFDDITQVIRIPGYE